MADDEGGKTLDDKLDELKRKAAVAAARRSIEKTGHGMLDGLERWLFGKVGGAEEVLRKEANRGTALDRLRTEIEHAEAEEELTPEAPAAGPTPAQKARERKREAALAQLEAIKQRLAEEDGGAPGESAPASEGTPPQRTLDPPLDDAPAAEPRRKKTPRSL